MPVESNLEAVVDLDERVVATRALEFGYLLRTRSVGVHSKPWGLAPFLPMPAAELCDRPVTVEQVGAGPPMLSCETGWPRRTNRTRC